jgi:ubiquinone/menaquinone biosynthesis C-methylase UbiE
MAEVAAKSNKNVKNVLDVGCYAGNAILNLLYFLKKLTCNLLDLSKNMLFRAKDMVGKKQQDIIQGDYLIKSAGVKAKEKCFK